MLQKAKMVKRKAIESLYDRTCDIYEKSTGPKAGSSISSSKPSIKYSDVKCRLSFKSLDTTTQTSTVATKNQVTKLIIAPELEIKAGSKIVVKKDGKEQTFMHSGESADYDDHQEIILTLGGYA